jgi:hypothetical protein
MPATAVSPSLIDAVKKGDMPTVRAYMAAGVEADSVDGVGRSALYHAASIGHIDIVKALLAHAADANLEDDVGETPFIAALAGGHFEVAQLLLDAGADANMPSGRQNQTPLHWAYNMDLKDEKISRVIWLLEHKANPHTANLAGRDVLQRAHDDERKWPFAGEILGHMEENIKSRDPAVIRARQMEQAKQELLDAIHGGIAEAIVVRPLRLQLKKQP